MVIRRAMPGQCRRQVLEMLGLGGLGSIAPKRGKNSTLLKAFELCKHLFAVDGGAAGVCGAFNGADNQNWIAGSLLHFPTPFASDDCRCSLLNLTVPASSRVAIKPVGLHFNSAEFARRNASLEECVLAQA